MKVTLYWMAFKPHDNDRKAIGFHSPKMYNHLEVSKYRFTLIEFYITN